MADAVADLTRTSGPIVWRGVLLRFENREDLYVKLTRLGRRSQEVGFSSRELIGLRDLVKDLITAEMEAHET